MANLTRFKAVGDTSGVTSSVRGWMSANKALTASLGVAVAGAAALARGAVALGKTVGELTRDTAIYGDEIAKTSRNLGVSAKALQAYRFAGEHAGASQKAVDTGLKTLNKNMLSAAEGSTTLARIFKDRLGVEFETSGGKLRATEDVFKDVAESIRSMGESSESSAILSTLLGRSGVELGNLMLTGSAGIDEMGARLDDLGGVMGGDALFASEEYQDAMLDLDTALGGVRREIGEQLIPAVTLLAEEMTNAITGGGLKELAAGVGGFALGLLPAELQVAALAIGAIGVEANTAAKETLAARQAAEEYDTILTDLTTPLRDVSRATGDGAAAKRAMAQAAREAAAAEREAARAAAEHMRALEGQARAAEMLAQRVQTVGLTAEEQIGVRAANAMGLLSEAMRAGIITSDEYAARMSVLSNEATTAYERLKTGAIETDAATQTATTTTQNYGQIVSQVGGITQQWTGALIDGLGKGKKGGDDLGKTILKLGISTATQIATSAAASVAANATTTASSVAAGAATTAAYAPAATVASIATFGGAPAAGSAGMAIAIPAITSLITGLMGAFAVGDSGFDSMGLARARMMGASQVFNLSGKPETLVDSRGTAAISDMLEMQRNTRAFERERRPESRGGGDIYLDGELVGAVLDARDNRRAEDGLSHTTDRRY